MASPSTIASALEYFTDPSNPTKIKSDLVLVVGEEKFYCHRLLLSLVSPVFKRMFNGEFTEPGEPEIVLEGKRSESILELLKHIYPQFNGEITNDNVEDFLQLADEYMIEHLKQPCEEVLVKQLNVFKYVLLPTEQKLEQTSSKAKHLQTGETSAHSMTTGDRPNTSSRRPTSSPTARPSPSKLPSTYLKPNEKTVPPPCGPPRHVLFLDRTKMPTFFSADQARILFTNQDAAVWLRRLRILYQIHQGRNYHEVIDSILSILQYIPSHLLLPLVHISMETYATDERMLNDIARARMFVLEEWATDGESYRPVRLTETYRTMSPKMLVSTSTPTPTQELIPPMTMTKLEPDLHEQSLDVISNAATLLTESDSEP